MAVVLIIVLFFSSVFVSFSILFCVGNYVAFFVLWHCLSSVPVLSCVDC